MKAVSVRQDISAKKIYAKAKKERDGGVRTRMLAIAAILEGKSRSEAAKIAGLELGNLRIWVGRFNENGFDGLIARTSSGRPPKWSKDMVQFLKNKVLEGLSFEKNQRASYRLEDFQQLLIEKFGVRFGLSTISEKLKEINFSWISGRRQHPKSDPAKQEAFKKKCQTLLKKFNNNTQKKELL